MLPARPYPAQACGGFFSQRTGERPSLAYEQTLIVFDDQKRQEHFVREVVFRKGNQPFGFVVPTPSRPEVFPVEKSPFKALNEQFPFFEPASESFGASVAGGLTGRAASVEVLDVKRVGSFTAFVLAANDAAAFARWLAREGFVSTKESDAWVSHYVSLGFYFVAMRYEPARGKLAGAGPVDPALSVGAETIRISFPTPLAYYPYLEPDAPSGQAPPASRLLEVWLVTRQRSVPVAARTDGGRVTWLRPLASGRSYGGFRENLAGALGESTGLVFDGSLLVQRFMDQKRSRAGFGDILFVPEAAGTLGAEARSGLRALLPILDPELPGRAPESLIDGRQAAP